MNPVAIFIFEIFLSLLPALVVLIIQIAIGRAVEFTGREIYISALIVSISRVVSLLDKVSDPDSGFSLRDFFPSITLLSFLGGILLLTILIAVSIIRSIPLILTVMLWVDVIAANAVVRYAFTWRNHEGYGHVAASV